MRLPPFTAVLVIPTAVPVPEADELVTVTSPVPVSDPAGSVMLNGAIAIVPRVAVPFPVMGTETDVAPVYPIVSVCDTELVLVGA
jgi:hypothetical protein